MDYSKLTRKELRKGISETQKALKNVDKLQQKAAQLGESGTLPKGLAELAEVR